MCVLLQHEPSLRAFNAANFKGGHAWLTSLSVTNMSRVLISWVPTNRFNKLGMLFISPHDSPNMVASAACLQPCVQIGIITSSG